MKALHIVSFVLFLLVLAGFGAGAYYLYLTEDLIRGKKIIGFSVLTLVFILIPLFLYIRLRGKKLKDYTLTRQNIQKWRKRLDKNQ